MSDQKQGGETGRILEIQRMSTEDGPGIRTTVFLKGCPLHCRWCHNPESISPLPQIQWIDNRCIGCRTCLETCPRDALQLSGSGMRIDRGRCDGCGRCVDACPSTAMELLGQTWHGDDLIRELIKDKAYFEKSGGGITLSGGEPTQQAAFAHRLLKGIRASGIHTALDTCGLCPSSKLEKLLPQTDLVLFDIKTIDSDLHKQFTGHGNRKILQNLDVLAAFMERHGRPTQLWIRTPMIPGATATRDNVQEIGRYLAEHLPGCVDRWELCAFNNLCRDKYLRLGMDWPFKNEDLIPKAEMERLAQAAKRSGIDPDVVLWTGSPRLEEAA
jgi:pyruvate formate lyase activating enzyme